MKRRAFLLVLGAVLIGGALAWRFATPPAGPALKPAAPVAGAPAPLVPAAATKPGLNTSVDPAAVFQRAFWRRPDASVRIVGAERREWADEKAAVQKWQWFIALEAKPEFRRWLLEDNPFDLARVETGPLAASLEDPPRWFPGREALAGYTPYRAAGGRLVVFADPKSGRIFAADTGAGFAAAAR